MNHKILIACVCLLTVNVTLLTYKVISDATTNRSSRVAKEFYRNRSAEADGAPSAPPVDNTKYDIAIGNSPVRGPANAKVTIVEFSDFQCPYCQREEAKLRTILKEFPKDVRLVWKHYPIPNHTKAPAAHVASIFAQKRGKFWEFHDLVFDNQNLETGALATTLSQVGVDPDEFKKALTESKNLASYYETDTREGQKWNIGGTPTIIVNGQRLMSRSLESYRARIREILGGK
jgi:protein-disulfide isomerase